MQNVRYGRGNALFQMIDHVDKNTYIGFLYFQEESAPTESCHLSLNIIC